MKITSKLVTEKDFKSYKFKMQKNKKYGLVLIL